jgi:hypothetical protein
MGTGTLRVDEPVTGRHFTRIPCTLTLMSNVPGFGVMTAPERQHAIEGVVVLGRPQATIIPLYA